MSKYLFFTVVVLSLVFAVGCGGGGGGGSVGPVTTPGYGTVTGSVSTTSVSGSMRANFLLTNAAADEDVEIGHYNSLGTFVGIKSGKTNTAGQYTFTDIPDNIKNLIVRVPGRTDFECVVPEVVKDSTVKAPLMDPDSIVTAMIIREAAKQQMSHKINMAEVLSKIPPSTLTTLKDSPNEIAKIATAFAARESALDAVGAQIGQDKLNQLRQFGFEQSRKIIEGIENGLYSREDGWQLFDRAMALQVEVLGLSADALMLIQQIDQKHIQNDIAQNVNLGAFQPEFERRIAERKVTEVIDRLIRAFKYFSDNSTISSAEYSFVKDALEMVKREVSDADNAGAIMSVLEPAMPRIASIIDKIMQNVGLMPDMPTQPTDPTPMPTQPPAPGTAPQLPPMAEVFQAMAPFGAAGPNPELATVAQVNTNVLAVLRRVLPNASAEMIDHLFAIIQGPIMGLGGNIPTMEPGSSTPPSFGGGATSVVGQVKELGADLKTGDYVYGIYPPEDRGTMPFARLKAGNGINLASYLNKWVEFEGTFDPTIMPPGFTVTSAKELDSAPADPRKREMSFSGPLNKTNATPAVYYIGPAETNTVDAGGRIKITGELDLEQFVGQWVNIKGYVTEWASGGAVPAEVKATDIAKNTSFTSSSDL